jgi:heme-degrading monooxygenase HmoA
MFARHVAIKLKEDSITKFARVIKTKVAPLLRKQEGFVNQVVLVSPERAEAIVITFWDKKESEEAFNRTQNPEVLRRLLEVIEGDPKVNLFEVINSIPRNLTAEQGWGAER